MKTHSYPVSIGTHPLEKLREISRVHSNGDGDKTAQHSDGWLRDIISKAVIEEHKKGMPAEHYPPISGGEHDFVATLEPTDLNGLPMPIKLIVVKDTQYGGQWAVTTALTEGTYKSRVESRAMYDESQETVASSVGDLSNLQSDLDSSIREMLASKDVLVVAINTDGAFDKAQGFDEKEDAIQYSNELMSQGYLPTNIRVFSFVKPKITITF